MVQVLDTFIKQTGTTGISQDFIRNRLEKLASNLKPQNKQTTVPTIPLNSQKTQAQHTNANNRTHYQEQLAAITSNQTNYSNACTGTQIQSTNNLKP